MIPPWKVTLFLFLRGKGASYSENVIDSQAAANKGVVERQRNRPTVDGQTYEFWRG